MRKPKIRVWATDSVGLIVLKATGIIISNQTGGHSCLQSEAEGIYIPLRTTPEGLEAYFIGEPWNGNCANGIDDRTADYIDQYFATVDKGALDCIRVDRTQLEASHEAWVYVDVAEPMQVMLPLFEGFGLVKGIVTWPNSD